jgi:DNA-3-methyladenine glycosylase
VRETIRRAEIAANSIDAAPARIRPLARAAVPRDTVALARFLLGKVVVRQFEAGIAAGRIVETEAYPPGDPACHAYRGMTPRNRSLFLDVGHAYVYRCYGTSWMLNVSSEQAGIGAGVLLRALEPLTGLEFMRARADGNVKRLARGPGRLAAALEVDRRQDGIDLLQRGPLWIGSDGTLVASIGESVRIGLTQGALARLRYFVAGNDYLSGTRSLNGRADR